MLLGLEYIHSQNVIYRDCKPENVFIDIDGHVRLADFGLSKQVPIKGGLNQTYCGSAEYMSPEMLRGDPYSYGIDFYSLGSVLYEMVTGLPPFYSHSQEEMFSQRLKASVPYPRKYISAELQSILELMLERDADRRVKPA